MLPKLTIVRKIGKIVKNANNQEPKVCAVSFKRFEGAYERGKKKILKRPTYIASNPSAIVKHEDIKKAAFVIAADYESSGIFGKLGKKFSQRLKKTL